MKRTLAAVLSMWPLLASSAEPLVLIDREALDFSVRLGKTESTFEYDDGRSTDNTYHWIGIAWREQLAPRAQLGLEGGGVSLSQTGNPITAGLEPDGYYAGLVLRLALFDAATAQLYSQVSYTYTRVTHKEDDESVVLSWYQPQVQLGAGWQPTHRLRLFTGAGWTAIDGQERVRGASAATVDFESERRGVAFAGLDFRVDRDGFVGFELRAGAMRGGEFYFQRYF